MNFAEHAARAVCSVFIECFGGRLGPKKTGISDRSVLLFSVLILLGAAAVYSRTLASFFVYDDFFAFTSYAKMMAGEAGLFDRFAWLTSVLSFIPQMALSGGDPFWFNLGNLLLHLLNVLLLGYAAFLITGKKPAALLAMAFFALSSQGCEAVLWISARCHLLVFTFILLSLIWFILWRRGGRNIFYVLSILAALLAALSLFNGVIVPLILAAWLFSEKKAGEKLKTGKAGKILLPYLLISVMYGIIYLFIKTVHPVEQYFRPDKINFLRIGKYFLEYFDIFYVNVKLFLLNITDIFNFAGLAGLILLSVLISKAKARGARFSLLLMLCCILGIFTVPTENYYQFGRYKYLPLAGFCLYIAIMLISLFEKRSLIAKTVAAVLAASVLISGYIFISLEQGDHEYASEMHRLLAKDIQRVYPALKGQVIAFEDKFGYSMPLQISGANIIKKPYFEKRGAAWLLIYPEDLLNFALVSAGERGYWERIKELPAGSAAQTLTFTSGGFVAGGNSPKNPGYFSRK